MVYKTVIPRHSYYQHSVCTDGLLMLVPGIAFIKEHCPLEFNEIVFLKLLDLDSLCSCVCVCVFT